jgi:hypothetical protein
MRAGARQTVSYEDRNPAVFWRATKEVACREE